MDQSENIQGKNIQTNKISYSVTVDGELLSCPLVAAIGSNDGEIMFYGRLKWGGRSIADVCEATDIRFSEEINRYVAALIPDRSVSELSVMYRDKMLMAGVENGEICFKLAKSDNNMAILFAFQMENDHGAQDASGFFKALYTAADFFGIREFVCYAQTGGGFLLTQMMRSQDASGSIPKAFTSYNFLAYADISLEGDGLLKTGVRELFGIKKTRLFLGADNQGAACMLSLGGIRTSFIESSELNMMMQFGSQTAFLIRGSFCFVGWKPLKDMTFTVDCGVSNASFQIEALAHVERPISLFGPFSIGDTCLMIRAGAGISFGLYSSIYIRNIQLFGAVILQVEGELVEPKLLSAAVSDLSIPILVDNLLGQHISGIECMDFIRILGLPFQDMSPFDRAQIKRKDISSIVNRFNAQVHNDSLRLEESQVQLTPFGEGTDLADLKRMRHYYINREGKLQLSAQFYYSTIRTSFGNYTVEPGIFLCGVIELFRKRFEVLFSLRESEGVLAYAKIGEIDLGFIRIGPSQYAGRSTDTIPVANNSVLSQFINPNQPGLVFFLSAGKSNVSFYLDGCVEILRMFRVDSRIIFMQGLVSVDLCTVWLSILEVSLHLKVDYGSFTSGRFEFALSIDTSRLTQKLNAVTEKIDGAVKRLREKIDNAKREVDRAQQQVNQLYGQIDYYNRRIEECRSDISHASWWKKAFVAIAKGIEIGAFEVAKAGIYTAIGVATAALNVAKGVLNLSEVVGEGVLKAVNAVIQGAMSLFYLNYIKLQASADVNRQYFLAEIDFVVLGKHYNLSKQIGKNTLSSSPTGALSDAINEKIEPDLNRIDQGAFRSSWRKYQHVEYSVEQHCKHLDQVKEHLNASVSLMQSMQQTYVEEMCIPMEEFDEMNVSMVNALQHVENTLVTGTQLGNMKALGNAMGGLKRSVAAKEKQGVFRDGELSETKQLIAEYDQGRKLYDKIVENIENVKRQRESMLLHNEEIHAATGGHGKMMMDEEQGNIAGAVLKVEEQMYEAFPVSRSGSLLINPSREEVIRDSFREIEERLNVKADARVETMRNRSRKGSYENRL
ncbi:MAG: hypothetical protein IJ661_00020 [Lachnospiraceae bacterium]|nr:hypothetical protein [Lachnospiraceae bacterium]